MNAEILLTPEDVAERLSLSPLTVGDMFRAGTLPGVKVGHLWRCRESDLDAYILALEWKIGHKRPTRPKKPQGGTQ